MWKSKGQFFLKLAKKSLTNYVFPQKKNPTSELYVSGRWRLYYLKTVTEKNSQMLLFKATYDKDKKA